MEVEEGEDSLLSTMEAKRPFDNDRTYWEVDKGIKLLVPSSQGHRPEAEAVVDLRREAPREGLSFLLLCLQVRLVLCMACKPPFS